MDFFNLKSVLENTEQEAEQAVEKRDECENRELSICDAISKLGDDVQLINRLQQNEQNAAGQRQEAQQEVESLKNRAQELESELQEMIKQNSESGRTLNQLQELGEDVQEGLWVLLERQTLIEECTERLQSIIEKLGLDSAEFGARDVKQFEAAQQERIAEHTDKLNTNNERNNSFNEDPKAEAKPSGYCGGIKAFGKIPSGYSSLINERVQKAQKSVRNLYHKFSNQLIIQDVDYAPDQTPHYSPDNFSDHCRGIYLNATIDLTNSRGPGKTFFHELGHMIDHAINGFGENASNTLAFYDALIADGKRVTELFNNASSESKIKFLKNLRSENAHSCSDLLDAVTDGKIHGKYGHSPDYWQKPGNLQAEAFAHFFEASMGDQDKLQLIKKMFPHGYQEFQRIVQSAVIPDELRERELQNTPGKERDER